MCEKVDSIELTIVIGLEKYIQSTYSPASSANCATCLESNQLNTGVVTVMCQVACLSLQGEQVVPHPTIAPDETSDRHQQLPP